MGHPAGELTVFLQLLLELLLVVLLLLLESEDAGVGVGELLLEEGFAVSEDAH